MKKYLFLYLLFRFCICNGQEHSFSIDSNPYFKNTSDTIRFADGIKVFQGIEKLIKIDTLHIIRDLISTFTIKYKGSTPLLFYKNRKGNFVWVKDSIWNTFDSIGNLIKCNYWQNGINLWSKSYNRKGQLAEYHYHDLINDTSFYETYIDEVLFKRRFYTPKDKNNGATIYYPNSPIRINDAELSFKSNFLYKPIDTIELRIYSKNTHARMEKIENFSKYINTNFPSGIDFKKDTLLITLTYEPKPKELITNDTLRITIDGEEYQVYITAHAFHIDYGNVDKIQKIELSRANDRYLYISSLGTATALRVRRKGTDKILKKHTKSIKYSEKYIQTDLSELNVGEYELWILSCNFGGIIDLVLNE